jgi:hypothetical protein
MAWDLEAEVMRAAPALVAAWRAKELQCRRVALETALRMLEETAASQRAK